MGLRYSFLLFIKGAIIGIANIIPGVSGGTLAVSLGIYETIINAIGNFFKNIKKNFLILLPLCLGTITGVLSTSKLVTVAMDKYKAQTIFLFVGLIFGGISLLMKKTRRKNTPMNITIFFIVFISVILINFLTPNINDVSLVNLDIIDYIKLLVIGTIASSAMVIPGISGSFILMLIGYYEPIINTIANLTDFANITNHLAILIPFGIGVVIGIIALSKLIMFLIKKNEVRTYFAIMGFVLSSIVVLLMQIESFTYKFTNIITCIVTFLWGYLLARNLEKEKH